MNEEMNTPAENTEVVDNVATESVRDADAVLRKNRELLKENAELKRLAEVAKNFDFDKARQAMDELQRAEEERLSKKGEYEKLIESKTKAYEERLENERKERSRIESTLKQEKLALALIERGVLPDRVGYLVKEISEQVELSLTESGFALKKLNGIGDADEFNALVEDVRSKSPFFFAANIAGGTGGSTSVSTGGTSGRSWSELSRSEKTSAIRDAGGDVELAKKKYT
jgi:transposase